MATTATITLHERDTTRIAAELAERLEPGTVVGLQGGLGLGKTVFAKALAAALGVEDTVTSQSYTMVAEYEGRLPFFHADLYRVRSAPEVETIGLEEYFDRGGVTVVEWCDRAPEILPPDAVVVSFELTEGGTRRITIEERTRNAHDSLEPRQQ